jgi:hypothetical protein
LDWKLGIGTQVQIGMDSIIGFGDKIFLHEGLVSQLHELGQCTLNRVGYAFHSNLGWFSAMDLGLDEIWHDQWTMYTYKLDKEHIHLYNFEDEISWLYNKYGNQYSTKLRYLAVHN